ncbi:hypothetical protein Acr_06g0009260 [Actinidia rufa]|uniref:Uncharacterized protein n=1 Tax=Actinidia rufa TaxID=165716 RepID=A0A7J0ERZ3_9ERIC|nr:hypothetical protein Acr_06g0009260 [Actinidia rufa]
MGEASECDPLYFHEDKDQEREGPLEENDSEEEEKEDEEDQEEENEKEAEQTENEVAEIEKGKGEKDKKEKDESNNAELGGDEDSSETESDASPTLIRKISQRYTLRHSRPSKFTNTAETALECFHQNPLHLTSLHHFPLLSKCF